VFSFHNRGYSKFSPLWASARFRKIERADAVAAAFGM
jgi:hypothetical protein